MAEHDKRALVLDLREPGKRLGDAEAFTDAELWAELQSVHRELQQHVAQLFDVPNPARKVAVFAALQTLANQATHQLRRMGIDPELMDTIVSAVAEKHGGRK